MDYISKPTLMGKLTCAEEQKKIKAMTGEEAYNEFLMLVNSEEKADVAPVRHTEIRDGECVKCGWFGDCVEALGYKFCPGCGAQVDGTQLQREEA